MRAPPLIAPRARPRRWASGWTAVVRKKSVKHRQTQERTRDAVRRGSISLGRCTIRRGDSGNWIVGRRAVQGEDRERPARPQRHVRTSPIVVGSAISRKFPPISDLLFTCRSGRKFGLYGCSGILAALLQRQQTGRGQYVTTCLLDVQIATLANQASGYLATQRNPRRMGNAHPSIVPYQSFQTTDGLIAIGVGNDWQFRQLCRVLNVTPLARDNRFATNSARVEHREILVPLLQSAFMHGSTRHWITELTAAAVPVGPVNALADVFADPHVVERRLKIAMPHDTLGSVPGVACPVRLSDSPPGTDRGPPALDQHGEQLRRQFQGSE